jgi:hypothetical protein
MTIKEQIRRCSKLTDQELWSTMPRLARSERRDLVGFLIHLMEIQRRDLHIERAYSGLYTYLIKLGFSEWESRARSIAVEAAGNYRSILGLLQAGRLTLTTLALIGPRLKADNYRSLLRKACRRSKREVEALVAGLAPQRAPRDSIRILSAPSPLEPPLKASPAPAGQPATVPASGRDRDLFGASVDDPAPPAGAQLYAIAFTASKETHDLLLRAKELLRHRFPKAGTDEIVNFALKRTLAEVDRDLRKPPRPPRPAREGAKPSRVMLESVKQKAWLRDGGQCAFVAADGTRCTARAWLEFDHELPFALGGSSRDWENARVCCFRHNQWAAKQAFGSTARDN